MAIQLPNPGLGDGQTGDNEYVMWTKVKDNFSNTTHAASRLVGTGAGQIPTSEGVVHAFFDNTAPLKVSTSEIPIAAREVSGEIDVSKILRGAYYLGSTVSEKRISVPEDYSETQSMLLYALPSANPNSVLQLSYRFNAQSELYIRAIHNVSVRNWAKVYTDVNTTKDTATGFLKASSPVLHVYNDSITKIHEAEQLDITVDKKGVGHYEIHGTTGLRKDDGWFMSPPRDVHGNVLCMVDLEEKDGVVILKTYKKLFDFETVSIVHDYENPMDIPEGVCVEFRFNDLPEEQLDEPIE